MFKITNLIYYYRILSVIIDNLLTHTEKLLICQERQVTIIL